MLPENITLILSTFNNKWGNWMQVPRQTSTGKFNKNRCSAKLVHVNLTKIDVVSSDPTAEV
uniref:Uncharacterized protein n=1 Tax=Arundo donax TaxID=35708 RepID=A0A0A9DMY5_ARUDO